MDLDALPAVRQRLSGNARLMSPSVVFEYKYDMLHVPVRQNNENTATVRQRMQAGCRILCIQFTNSDAFAAGVVLTEPVRKSQ